jgi:hypothetical protein
MEKNNIDLVTGAIISCVAVLLIGETCSPQGSKLNILEYYLKKDYPEYENYKLYNHKTKKYLKLSYGAYGSWTRRVFELNKSPKIKSIRELCTKTAKKASHAFTSLKEEVNKFLVNNDCVLTEPIAYTCAICSVLHFAVEYCNLCQSQTTEYSDYWYIFNYINPKQLFQNVKNIYEGLPMPNDLDVMTSEKIVSAMDNMVDEIYTLYKKNFTY